MAKIATKDKIVRDPVMGIDRRVLAGQEVPPDLLVAYEEAGGEISSSRPSSPGRVIAAETVTLRDEALGIDRRVIAGLPVPPDLIDAYHDQVGEAAEDDPDENPDDKVGERDNELLDELDADERAEVEKLVAENDVGQLKAWAGHGVDGSAVELAVDILEAWKTRTAESAAARAVDPEYVAKVAGTSIPDLLKEVEGDDEKSRGADARSTLVESLEKQLAGDGS